MADANKCGPSRPRFVTGRLRNSGSRIGRPLPAAHRFLAGGIRAWSLRHGQLNHKRRPVAGPAADIDRPAMIRDYTMRQA